MTIISQLMYLPMGVKSGFMDGIVTRTSLEHEGLCTSMGDMDMSAQALMRGTAAVYVCTD